MPSTALVAEAPLGAPRSLHVLEKRDVQRICSGQSVVDLATAVKELVENALDAGATLIEVKLKDFGKESIEVSDNGSGISPANYASVARKHYTSKISRFEDIEAVTSFGFRGEALSSICELVSSFSVCTRTRDDEIGALLEFDRSGALVQQTPKARPVGTTVVIDELFKPLAVRHKDFHRNIKKHYAKLLKVLQAYAVSTSNVKLCVLNASGKHAARQVVLSTQAQQSMGDNIASVFGTKFARTLVAVDIDLTAGCERIRATQRATAAARRPRRAPKRSQSDDGGGGGSDDDNERDTSLRASDDETDDAMSASQLDKTRRVVGFVSKVGAGVGRSDNDRQFFFINSRPFDLPKVAKALNEVWRQFEMKQKPACVLNFLLPLGEYDVNVTPDKRETFLKHEPELIEAFKIQLTKLYEPSRGTFTVQPLLSTFARVPMKPDAPATPSQLPAAPAPELSTELQASVAPTRDANATSAHGSQHSLIRPHTAAAVSETSRPVARQQTERGAAPAPTAVIVEVLSPKRSHAAMRSPMADDAQSTSTSSPRRRTMDTPSHSACCASSSPSPSHATTERSSAAPAVIVQQPRLKKPRTSLDTDGASGTAAATASHQTRDARRESLQSSSLSLATVSSSSEWSWADLLAQRKQFFAAEVADELARRTRQSRLKVPPTCSAGGDIDETNDASASTSELDVDNDVAAAALQRVLKKDDFLRMEVLGQFNLGFIIGKLDNDLFIIDQHASDEKFNFETLQQTTVLHQQPLVRPLPLELTAGEEMVVLDHMDVFAKNGFTFLVDADAPATKKLKLLSLPFTKQTQFGVEDIRELASLLMDAPLNAASIRLPKIMAMFASRACRSSIMIGTALHKEEMIKIVRNLSGLEQPWNCPHGRPTLRHLVDLRQLHEQS